MELSTVTIDPLRVACLRHVGPFSTIEESWTKFHDVLRAQGVSQPAPEFLSVYHWHDEGTPPAQHQSDCALVIPESFHPS
ncbi:MAG TPA: GyrI-like domain-containing protein, partial [bacterium]|nr:GyrI-like domain-containing protein [bacterium]